MSSSVSQNTLDQIASLLNSERSALRALKDLLTREQTTLVGSSLDDLVEIIDQKNATLASLEQQAKNRLGLLRQVGLPPNSDTEDWLEKTLPGSVPAWREIAQLLDETRHLNQVNGELIQTRLRINQQALTVLHNAAQSASLYGPDGQHNHPGSGRILGSG